jgi:hypothetical protein
LGDLVGLVKDPRAKSVKRTRQLQDNDDSNMT